MRLVLLQIDKAVMRLILNSQVKLVWFILSPFLFDNKNTIKYIFKNLVSINIKEDQWRKILAEMMMT